MDSLSLVIVALFLPLFPLGMLFNMLFQRMPYSGLRALMLLLWPLPGVWILSSINEVPGWILYWALFSAALYGFRAVVVKDFSVWTGFLATSTWSLGWIATAGEQASRDLLLHVMAFSMPLALLTVLVYEIEKRYESAYAGVVSGVAQSHPKLSGLLVLVVMAAIASPLFPGFFSMIAQITLSMSIAPVVAAGLALVWLLWSWSGIRLLQEMLVGPAVVVNQQDISQPLTLVYGLMLVLLVTAGIYISGVVL